MTSDDATPLSDMPTYRHTTDRKRGARWLGGLALAAGLLAPTAAMADDPTANDDPASWSQSTVDWSDEAAWDIPGRIVVDARDDRTSSQIADLASRFGLSFRPTGLEAETRIEIADVAAGAMAELLDRLNADGDVQWAEPLARVRAMYDVDDPLMKDQWHLTRVNAPRAWDFTTGRGVTVAVVDTGIACETHGPFTKGTDLAQTECVGGWNFVANNEHANDDQGHGSHVAGTVAQSTNNHMGAAGVAFDARLMPVKVLNENGWGTTADVADGIRWAADHGAQVINLSLGGPRNSKVLQDAVDHARSRGVVIVAAAGNSGGSVGFPGGSEGVIGVSATDSGDKLASFSSRGKGVDIAAPGVNVVQQTICKKGRDGCEIFPGYSGTSMASPHVAGSAALLVSLGVSDPAAVEQALASTARVVDDSDSGKTKFGAGILDTAAAVERVTLVHAVVRLAAVLILTLFVGVAARRKNDKAASPWRLSFWLPALAAGPGLLFFAPYLLARAHLGVDVLARPIGDLDLLIGASLHRFLPLANALVPFGALALFFGNKAARPAIAGLAVGTAAYLGSIAALGEAAAPFGQPLLLAWTVGNALLCAWIARFALAESN